MYFKINNQRALTVRRMLCVICFIGALSVSCGEDEGETTSPTESLPSETSAVPEASGPVESVLITDGTDRFTLSSLTASMEVTIENHTPSIVSLVTESGTEKITSPTPFALPSHYCTYDDEGNRNDAVDFAWQYTGHTTYSDGDGGSGYGFCFKDETVDATYRLYMISRAEMAGPFEIFGYLDNNTAGTLYCTPEDYFTVAVDGDSAPTTWSFDKESGGAEGYEIWNGAYTQGPGIYQRELTEGEYESIYSVTLHHWNLSGFIPMMYLDYGTDGVYYAQEWSNGTLTATGLADGGASLAVCVGDDGFDTNLPPGETLYLPSVYLGVYDGDVDIGSNEFKHWFLQYKAPDNILENEDEPRTQKEMAVADNAGENVTQYGFQQIKWDHGWWSEEGFGTFKAEGSTEVKSSQHLSGIASAGCSTLEEYVEKAHNAGVGITMYFLLKDTKLDQAGVPTSVGENGHPEWFSHTVVRGGASADLGNEECVEFYKEYLYDFFTKTGVDTWRSDFEPICYESDKENRHEAWGNDTQYWCTVGFADVVDHLLENIDGFRYESCSSGGSMKDFFTATKATVINCDDSGGYQSLHASFYDSSYCIHPAQLQLPVRPTSWDSTSEYYTGGSDDYLYGLRTMLTGALHIAVWYEPTDEDKSYWPYYINEVYNTLLKPLIRYGDLYHILPRPDGVHWDGLQYIDADSENVIKGVVMLWKPTNEEGETKTIFLRGLEEDTVYRLTFEDRAEQNCQVLGSVLMKDGLTVTIEGESGSEMIWISEAE